ncbi:MAG: bifunctional UDP-N-acetylglucosamine diphosphorylase/glucosamine-1-phosphate N-acetyltransferase GlmU [Actinomycetota bacterium]
MSKGQLICVVLAAGSGTRMLSSTPKVMHPLAGRPILGHVMATAMSLQADSVVVVLRHQKELLQDYLTKNYPDALIAEQDEIAGTGRAVEASLNQISPDYRGEILVISGDVPMLDEQTLTALVKSHRESGASATILTALLEDPTGYGRIIRSPDGSVSQIVEQLDGTNEQLEIKEINSGVYVFNAEHLKQALSHLHSHNAQGERYLTDVAALLVADSHLVRAEMVRDNWLVHGINDRAQLAEVGKELNRRICHAWQLSGVSILDPDTTWIDVTVSIGNDATIHPSSYLRGATEVGPGAEIGPSVVIENSVVRAKAKVGPFAYLRAGTDLGEDGKIGSFVETKKAVIGRGSKVPHLSYVGDAEIGEFSNIGAGTIFANYDGVEKHSSKIGSHVKTGSHNVFVAPITIGDGAYTAAGTVVRRNVAPGELGMNVAPQRNIANWVIQKRPGSSSADAASKSKTN